MDTIKKISLACMMFCLFLAACSKNNGVDEDPVPDPEPEPEPIGEYDAKPKSLRAVLLLPNNVEQDNELLENLENSLYHAQSYFQAMLDGHSFLLNDEPIQIVEGLHNRNWYMDTKPGNDAGDRQYASVNAYEELIDRDLIPENDNTYKWLIFIPVAGESYNNGSVSVMALDDLEGLKSAVSGDILKEWRKVGQFIGRTFFLPVKDSENSLMTQSAFVNYPNNQFDIAETDILLGESESRNVDFLSELGPLLEEESSYRVKYENSIAIGIADGQVQPAASLLLQNITTENYQQWHFERNEEFGTYLIRSAVDRNLGWDIKMGASHDGAELGIWHANPIDKNHRYYILKIGKEKWTFISEMHLKGIRALEEGPVVLWPFSNEARQRFSIEKN